MSENKLEWEQIDRGWWLAASALADGDIHFDYDIECSETGMFDVSNSDSELVGLEQIPPFETLRAAQEWCQANEAKIIQAAKEDAATKPNGDDVAL